MKKLIGLAAVAVLLIAGARVSRRDQAASLLSDIKNESLRDAPSDNTGDSSPMLDKARRQVEGLTGEKTPPPALFLVVGSI